MVRLGAGFGSALGAGLANGVEPMLFAVLVQRRLGRVPDLSRQRDLGVFLGAAAGIGPAVGAAVGVGSAWLLGEAPLWPRIGRWYLGDAVGVLVVALAVAMPWDWSAKLGLPFALIPVLGLIGMRMGTRAAAAAVCILGALVETLTAAGTGPFATTGAFNGLVVAQTYLATCSISSLPAAALMTGLVRREDLALHDTLTGLANRRLLLERMTQARRRLRRFHNGIGLVYADLDGFKQINDAHGHAIGDQVLIATAQRLSTIVRANDTVARLGGDEFVVLVDDLATDASLDDLMRRMTAAIEAPIEVDEGPTVSVGASLGAAVTRDPDEAVEDFLERADRAMYEVKRAGRAVHR